LQRGELLALMWEDIDVAGGQIHVTRSRASARSVTSVMIAGVNAKAVSTYKGHADISITLDRYGHLMPRPRPPLCSTRTWLRAFPNTVCKLRRTGASVTEVTRRGACLRKIVVRDG
jgi:integrase